jgi:DNA-binding NarL/FixJ family response regulator
VIRVLVAEDHPLMREAIESRLRGVDDVEIVGAAADGRELVALYADLRPDVVLTDCAMPEMSGIEATVEIRRLDPAARVVVLSAIDDQSTLADAVHAGAIGYLVKSVEPAALVQSVRAAAAGEPVFDAAATRLVMAELRTPSKAPPGRGSSVLSRREAEILALVADGLTNAEVGEKLFISPQTVKTHMERIFGKLGVRGRAAAVREGISRGIV